MLGVSLSDKEIESVTENADSESESEKSESHPQSQIILGALFRSRASTLSKTV